MNWDAITAIGTMMLAGVTTLGVIAALYAGFYAKKAYDVSQSQRQIDNVFRYVESLESLLKNSKVQVPSKGEMSFQDYFYHHKAHIGIWKSQKLDGQYFKAVRCLRILCLNGFWNC